MRLWAMQILLQRVSRDRGARCGRGGRAAAKLNGAGVVETRDGSDATEATH